LGCWISPCYGPFSLGARFETYEAFGSLIFQFFSSGRAKPRITETADTESVDIGHHCIGMESILKFSQKKTLHSQKRQGDTNVTNACLLPKAQI
jgi:hypothetical protein